MKTAPWIVPMLAQRSACLRYLVLTQLLGRPDTDAEVEELASLRMHDELVMPAVELQRDDGSWGNLTSWMLLRMATLGFGPDNPVVRRGAQSLFDRQQADGSWPLGGGASDPDGGEADEAAGYDVIPLQTALPLIGLAASGYATDPRCERAYDWLLAQRLDDGAWPTGYAGGTLGRVAGYRRLAHSRWGCRSNTTAALVAMSYHPVRCRDGAAFRALDLVLGRETRERRQLGFEVARAVGFEPVRGFMTRFARFDPGLVLELAARIGAPPDEPRLHDLIDWVVAAREPHGVWEYVPHPAASPWMTLAILRSLRQLNAGTAVPARGGGVEELTEPRTPFQPYPRERPRH